MTDHEIENNLESPMVNLAARANELALKVSLLRDRSTDVTLRQFLDQTHDVIYGYAVDVYHTLTGQRHKHSGFIAERYHLRSTIPRLLDATSERFTDLEELTNQGGDFVLDMQDALILADRQFFDSIADFENIIVNSGGIIRIHNHVH